MGAGNQGAFAGADGKIMDKIRRVIGIGGFPNRVAKSQ
jgi:hypothetical protein